MPCETNQADYYRDKGYWTDLLLTDYFEQAVTRFPEKIAVKDERFGSVSYTELKIIDDSGNNVAAGEEGEMVMRSPSLFLGYFKRDQLNAESFLPGRWFRTGDLAGKTAAVGTAGDRY